MREPWWSIQLMPYDYFLETLKWKVNLEEEKRKQLEGKSTGGKTYSSEGMWQVNPNLVPNIQKPGE